MSKIKRGLVISAGGSWGAYGGGTIAALNRDYDVIAGISTGALMSPLVAINKFDVLERAYTSVKGSDIFDYKWYKPKPITSKGKLNILAVIYALITGNESIATAYNLRKLIDKFILKEDYNLIREQGKSVIVGSQNLRENPSKIHYFDIQECSFEDFKDWMWASAVAPFYTNLVNKKWTHENGNRYEGQWTDGGLSELIPLKEVLKNLEKFKGFKKEIDVIIHKSEPISKYNTSKIKNLLNNFNSVIGAMRHDIEFENLIEKVEYFSKKEDVTINLYYLPRELSKNAMVFNKNEMMSWWKEGFDNTINKTSMIRFESKR